MKKILIYLFISIIFLCAQNCAFAGDFRTITKNPKIAISLQKLEDANKKDVLSILYGKNSTGKPIRVMFRELEVYGLANCEAVTLKTQSGGLIIFINKKHETAPAEAIACLIAHESQHHPMSGTVQEEVRAWIMEVSTWNMFVRGNKDLAYSQSQLVRRLNYLERLYVADNHKSDKIEAIIAKNPMYKKLN